MMPLFYSEKEAKENNMGWYRTGYNIAYYASKTSVDIDGAPGRLGKKDDKVAPTQYHTLSFKFTLKHDDDIVYLAMCYPYTYTDCVRFLDGLGAPPENQ